MLDVLAYLSANEQYDSMVDTLTNDVSDSGEGSHLAGIPEAVIVPMESGEQSNESDGVIHDIFKRQDAEEETEKEAIAAEPEDSVTAEPSGMDDLTTGDSNDDTQIEEESPDEEQDTTDVDIAVEQFNAKNQSIVTPHNTKDSTMLNVAAYTVSNENIDEIIPSPLVQGDNPVIEQELPGDDLGDLPLIEESVVLPPHLDPAPMDPLAGDIVQEAVIAENLETEAGQLMGASIALEGYAQLLKASGPNLTRQSAAFMAVGMRRANRLIPGVSLGMEDEDSGTQVMAMQKSSVDEKGLGDKIKDLAGKIWEWMKTQYARLKELWEKAKSFFNKDKEKAVYLIAAGEAIKSGDLSKVKGLQSPGGLRTIKVLEGLPSTGKLDPAKSITLPAALAVYVLKGDKFGLVAKNGHDAQAEYINDAAAFTKAVNAYVSTLNPEESTADDVTSHVEGLLKQHMGKAKTYTVMGGFTIERTAEGVLEINDPQTADSAVEIPLPSMDEIIAFLKTVGDDSAGSAAFDAYLDAGAALMSNNAFARPEIKALAPALVDVFRKSGVDKSVQAINTYVTKATTRAVAACDFLIAAHAGESGTISQEDFENLPAVAPQHNTLGARAGSAIKAGWQKAKEFFRRIWEQIRNWVTSMWERIFGNEKKVDILLLTNAAIPDEGGMPSGEPLALPPGTGLKSVAAAKALSGPTTTGETPVEVVPEPVADTGTSLPKGHIYTDALKKLKLGSGYAFEPSIEESLINWFTRSYNPAVIKMWRDITSMANSNFDVANFDSWGQTLTEMAAKVMANAPVGEIPGGESLILNTGTIAFSFSRDGSTESEPVKALNKRQIDQILARQKRAFQGLALAQKATDEQNRLHEQFSQVIERLVNSSDETKASQYSAFYTTVNRLMCNTAVRQLASTINSRFTARTDVMDEMIASRAKRG